MSSDTSSFEDYKTPMASPLNGSIDVKSNYYSNTIFHSTPYLTNKRNSLKYTAMLINEEVQVDTALKITRPMSWINCNNISNILSTNQVSKPSPPVTFENLNNMTKGIQNKENKNGISESNEQSDDTSKSCLKQQENSESKIQSNALGRNYSTTDGNNLATDKTEATPKPNANTAVISDGPLTTHSINTIKKQQKYDVNVHDESDLLEIFQLELCLKTFPGKIAPFLKSLNLDILKLMDPFKHAPDDQQIGGSKTVSDILNNILAITNQKKNPCIDTGPNEDIQLTPLIDVDFNALQLLNDKLERVNTILGPPVKRTTNCQKVDENLVEDRSENSIGGIKLPELAELSWDSTGDVVSSIQCKTNDAFDQISEIYKSNSSRLSADKDSSSKASLVTSVENNSLMYVQDERSRTELAEKAYEQFVGDRSENSLGGLKLPKPAEPSSDSTEDVADDSFDRVGEINKSISLRLLTDDDCGSFRRSFSDNNIGDGSFKYADKRSRTELSEKAHEQFVGDRSENYLGCLKLPEPAEPSSVSTEDVADDSFDRVREINKSISLRLLTDDDCGSFSRSFSDNNIGDDSFKYADKRSRTELSEIVTPGGIGTLYEAEDRYRINAYSPADESDSTGSRAANADSPQTEPNEKRYSLRKRPRQTEHYFAPFTPSFKRIPRRKKTNYNDVFLAVGEGEKKVMVQYKVHRVLKICPAEDNNGQDTALIDVSNRMPRINLKPCPCGIFPSQVPSTWDSSLHKSLHQNLHKLRFSSQITPESIVSKCNDNGFLYDVIKITEHCGTDDANLKLTLKNIQEFIDLELDFSNNAIKNNHSVFLAVNPRSKIIGYLEVELLNNACIYQNNQTIGDLIPVKYGVFKLWVMVKYRKNGVATRLLKQFRDEENLNTNDIAFAYHKGQGITFIKKFFGDNPVLIY